MNVAKWMIPWKRFGALCMAGCVTASCLCACQKAPDKSAVVSKNDGSSFENKLVPDNGTTPTDIGEEKLQSAKDFSSTDGSVRFSVNLNTELPTGSLSVVEVQPHILTAEDIKQVATTLLPTGEFYYAEPLMEHKWTKSEINERLKIWQQYASAEALKEVFPNFDQEGLEKQADIVRAFITKYTELYERTPEGNPHTPLEWKLDKVDKYIVESEFRGDLSKSNDGIAAQTVVDGIPYFMLASTRDKKDFQLNMISLNIQDGIWPEKLDKFYYDTLLYSEEKPTEEQLKTIEEKAQKMLDGMQLGNWKVDSVSEEMKVIGSKKGFAITVSATPVLNGMSAVRWKQLGSLKNPNGYAPEQYYTDAKFQFNADGTLISFDLRTPLDVQELQRGTVLDSKALMDRLEEFLSLSDARSFDYDNRFIESKSELACTVEISEMQYGLSRVQKADSQGYYYVPTVIFLGVTEITETDTGAVSRSGEKAEPLFAFNAIDGSEISLNG